MTECLDIHAIEVVLSCNKSDGELQIIQQLLPEPQIATNWQERHALEQDLALPAFHQTRQFLASDSSQITGIHTRQINAGGLVLLSFNGIDHVLLIEKIPYNTPNARKLDVLAGAPLMSSNEDGIELEPLPDVFAREVFAEEAVLRLNQSVIVPEGFSMATLDQKRKLRGSDYLSGVIPLPIAPTPVRRALDILQSPSIPIASIQSLNPDGTKHSQTDEVLYIPHAEGSDVNWCTDVTTIADGRRFRVSDHEIITVDGKHVHRDRRHVALPISGINAYRKGEDVTVWISENQIWSQHTISLQTHPPDALFGAFLSYF